MMTDEYLEKLRSTEILGDSEAVRFCEEHQCENCPVNYRDDIRMEEEKNLYHVPCCVNLTKEDLANAKR